MRVEPSGLKFSTPVTVRFNVPRALQGRLPKQLPLQVFNPLTNKYEGTGFQATLSADGTSLSATVTHFTVFVLLQPFQAFAASVLKTGTNVMPLGIASVLVPAVTPPAITGFNPISGPVGTVVTISGTNLTSTSVVAFGGTPATTFTVNSDISIAATVPSGAATGPITVTTAGGTAFSATDFTVTIPADLSISKSASANTVALGGTLTYTITVSNIGASPAANATVTDPLPAGVSFVSCTASVGSCSQANGTVTALLGTLAPNASATVGITVTVANKFSPALSGLVNFGATASGAYAGVDIWNTLGGDSNFNLYVAANSQTGAFLNSGDSSAASINTPLLPGNYTFALFGEPGPELSNFGLNLFFNGNNSAPGISVFAAQDVEPSPPFPAFTANSSTSALTLAGTPVAGAGTLVYTDGTTTVTLTDYSWSRPAVFSLNRVQGFNNTSGGGNDFVGALSLNVTANAPTASSAATISNTATVTTTSSESNTAKIGRAHV